MSVTTTDQQTVSPVDALWALYQSQSKKVRKAFRIRLLAEEKEQVAKTQQAKAKETEFEYVPNAVTRAAIEECESGVELETLDITNFKDYVLTCRTVCHGW